MDEVKSDPKFSVVKVSGSSSPQAVAGAIAKCIRTDGVYPDVTAVGHSAVGQAVKALAIARGFLATSGIDLAVTPFLADGPGEVSSSTGEPTSITVTGFKTFSRG